MSNLYQIMRQIKSEKSPTSSVGETVQSPDKSSTDVTPTINHRKKIAADENVLVEKMCIPEISPEHDDAFDDVPAIKEIQHSRVESNGGKLSSFLSRDVGTLSRDILVQGDSGSVVSELTFDHALRPLAHHQVLSTLAARRIQEEVASCESGETSFTPRTRGNATTSEGTTSEMYYHNSFQMSLNEDALPPLYERAHNTDEASESGLHQPPVTPSPHSSFRNLYATRGSSWRAGSSRSVESTDESLQYSEQDSAVFDDQSFSGFSLSTYGHSVVSRGLRPTRVETVEEETTQNEDSGCELDIAAEAAVGMRNGFFLPLGTDESVDFSEKDAIDASDRGGATYVSSATESYVSTSYASTAGYSVRSAKPRWTTGFLHPSTDASVGSESNAPNIASNIASEDSVHLASLEESYPQIEQLNYDTPNPESTTPIQANKRCLLNSSDSNPMTGLTTPIPLVPSEVEDNFEVEYISDVEDSSEESEVEDLSEVDAMSLSRETTLLIDLESLTGPDESAKPDQSLTESATPATPAEDMVHQDLSPEACVHQMVEATPQQTVVIDKVAEASTQQVAAEEKVDEASPPQIAAEEKVGEESQHQLWAAEANPPQTTAEEKFPEEIHQTIPAEDLSGELSRGSFALSCDDVKSRDVGNEAPLSVFAAVSGDCEKGSTLEIDQTEPMECRKEDNPGEKQGPVAPAVEHHALPVKAENYRCQIDDSKEESSEVRQELWCVHETQDTITQDSSTVDLEHAAEKQDLVLSGKGSPKCCTWKLALILLGFASLLAVLAVPAVIIPLVIMHSHNSHRKLRGVLHQQTGNRPATVLQVATPTQVASQGKVLELLTQVEPLLIRVNAPN